MVPIRQRSAVRISEFATILGISLSCARVWVSQRRVASIRLGRLVYVPVTEVDRLLQEGLIPAAVNE